jgi:hypothetical protein
MATGRVRLTNQEDGPKHLSYREGPAPKPGEKDTRPVKTLVLGPSSDRAARVKIVDNATYRALAAQPAFQAFCRKSQIEISSGDDVDLGA